MNASDKSPPAQTLELAALADVCQRLDVAGIDYMLTGSFAMAYYARPRMTRDLDLVIKLDAKIVDLFVGAFNDTAYHLEVDAVVESAKTLRPFNLIHFGSMVKIDLIPRKNDEYRLLEFARRQRVQFGALPLWIAAIEDLILSKLVWAQAAESVRQESDVRLLLTEPHDSAYLAQWAARLGLSAQLERLTGDAQ